MQFGLGFALELPVEYIAFNGKCQGGGHLDKNAFIAGPGLDQADRDAGVFGQPVGQDTACRSCTDDYVIEFVNLIDHLE
ncbi:hypothetical protein D3C85_1473320 [compost metagenome]